MNRTCKLCGKPIWYPNIAYCDACRMRVYRRYKKFRETGQREKKCLICGKPLTTKQQRITCCDKHSMMVRTMYNLVVKKGGCVHASSPKIKESAKKIEEYHNAMLDECIRIAGKKGIEYGEFMNLPKYAAERATIRKKLGLV